jgi:hypothetical protein
MLPVFKGKQRFSEDLLKIKLDEFRQNLEERRLRMEVGLPEGVDWPRSRNGDGLAGMVSFGGSIFEAKEFLGVVTNRENMLDKLLGKADEELYEAKTRG